MGARKILIAAVAALALSGGTASAAVSNESDISANDVTTSRPSGLSTNGMEPSPSHFQQSREFRSNAYGPYDQGVMASHQGPIGGSPGEGGTSR